MAFDVDDKALCFAATCQELDESIVLRLAYRFAKATRPVKTQGATVRQFIDERQVVELFPHDRPALGGRYATTAGAPTSTERDHEIPLGEISNSIGSG